MRPGSFQFSGKWAETVRHLDETGMGYTVVAVKLVDRRQFDQVLIDSGNLTRVRRLPDIPFVEDDIATIRETGAK